MPAQAGIQYAAVLTVKMLALWNTGSRKGARFRGDDAEKCSAAPQAQSCHILSCLFVAAALVEINSDRRLQKSKKGASLRPFPGFPFGRMN
jgi:hypothetical protein